MFRKIVYLKNCYTVLNEIVSNGIVPLFFVCFLSMHTSSLPGGPLPSDLAPNTCHRILLGLLVSMGRAQLVSKRQRRHDAIKTTLISFFFKFFFFFLDGPFLSLY